MRGRTLAVFWLFFFVVAVVSEAVSLVLLL